MQKTWVLVAAILGSAMTFIDGTAVNVALPIMQRDLAANAAQMQWVVEGYAVFLASLLLLGGALGDIYGRKRLFLIGVVVFGVASLACGLAPGIGVLLAARCVQGAGAALAVPESLALLSATFEGEARGRAIGTWSGFASITAAGGPILGGWLAQHASWRWVFAINIPLALLTVALTQRFVPESRDERAPRSIDIPGALLATVALGALTFGLIGVQGRTPGPDALLAVGTGLVLLAVFVFVEARSHAPMMPLSLFSSRAFCAANAYTFFLYAALGGSLYFVPFVLVDVQHYTPTAAGAAILPFIVIQFTFSRWSGGLVARIGARVPLIAGGVLAAAAFVAYALPGLDRPYWNSYLPAAILLGAAGVCFVAPLTTTVFDAVPTEESGVASGVNNAVARTAGVVAVAGFGIVFAAFAPDGTADPDRLRQLAGFRGVMCGAALVCAVAAAIAFAIPPRVKQRA